MYHVYQIIQIKNAPDFISPGRLRYITIECGVTFGLHGSCDNSHRPLR